MAGLFTKHFEFIAETFLKEQIDFFFKKNKVFTIYIVKATVKKYREWYNFECSVLGAYRSKSESRDIENWLAPSQITATMTTYQSGFNSPFLFLPSAHFPLTVINDIAFISAAY